MKSFIKYLVLLLALGVGGISFAQEMESVEPAAMPTEQAAPESAPAPEAAAEEPTLDSGSTAWMISATVLVIMMTIPGLALFYGGSGPRTCCRS